MCDWLATFAELAGVAPDAGEPHAVAPLDSRSAWSWLSGRAAASRRTELVYEHNMFEHPIASGGPVEAAEGAAPGALAAAPSCYTVNVSGVPRCVKGALSRGGWKLVLGPEKQNGW